MNPLAQPIPTPQALNTTGFQALRAQMSQDNQKSDTFTSQNNKAVPQPKESSLLSQDSLVNKVAQATGKERYLSVFVALSDTLVKIYQTMMARANRQQPTQAVSTAPKSIFPPGGILA